VEGAGSQETQKNGKCERLEIWFYVFHRYNFTTLRSKQQVTRSKEQGANNKEQGASKK
jgi:hypothetical protein